MACWNTRSTPVPAYLRGGRCRRCCWVATMPRSAIGADGRALLATLRARPDLFASAPMTDRERLWALDAAKEE